MALKVAGRYLYSRKRDTWDDAFKKLGKCLCVAVYQQALFSLSSLETMSFFSVYDLALLIIFVSFYTGEAKSFTGSQEDGLWSVLRVSFDSLAEEEQKMFLDAATVYSEKRIGTNVLGFWKGCGWSASSGWENLLDRCLVTVYGKDGWIDMHEVLRDLGRSIACPDRDDITTHTRIFGAKNVKALCEVFSATSPTGPGIELHCSSQAAHFNRLQAPLGLQGVFLYLNKTLPLQS